MKRKNLKDTEFTLNFNTLFVLMSFQDIFFTTGLLTIFVYVAKVNLHEFKGGSSSNKQSSKYH